MRVNININMYILYSMITNDISWDSLIIERIKFKYSSQGFCFFIFIFLLYMQLVVSYVLQVTTVVCTRPLDSLSTILIYILGY